jgi:hypothetical protein
LATSGNTETHLFCCQAVAKEAGVAKKNLTDRTLKALKTAKAGKHYDVFDVRFPGFGVRVADTGRLTFVLTLRYPGSKNPTRRALGRYPALSLEQARARQFKARCSWHRYVPPDEEDDGPRP